MRQRVKNVKNGQEVTFICSNCENIIDIVFIPTGGKYEPNWNKIPEKCSCGERLIYRQPIIDKYEENNGADNSNVDDVDNDNIDNESDLNNDSIDNETNHNDNSINNMTNRNDDDRIDDYNDGDNYNIDAKNSEVYKGYIRDLERAISFDYFEMRLKGLKRNHFKVPDNIDLLRLECIHRNISRDESIIEGSRCEEYDPDNMDIRARLSMLKQRHTELSNKLERR